MVKYAPVAPYTPKRKNGILQAMTSYLITYRGKDGKPDQMMVEAADRNALFAELEKRGVRAIRVEEANGKARRRGMGTGERGMGNGNPAMGKPFVRGLVAGVLVVVAAGAWLFLSSPKSGAPAEKADKKPSKIIEVEPSSAAPAKAVEANAEPVQLVTNRHGKVVQKTKPETYVDARGVERYVKGNGRVPLKNPEKYLVKSVVYPNAYPDFKHDSENEIANLLTIESGGMIFGDREYDKRFEQDFMQALKEPVEITAEDSEEDRRIKENVEAAKKEIAERIKQGENLADILTAERDEIRRLAQYKQQMSDIFHEQIASGEIQTEQDLDDFCKAVNTMLESKGIEPLKISGLMRRRLGLDRVRSNETQTK